jgi:glycosyltransferase involved in cell wall biosynthesis
MAAPPLISIAVCTFNGEKYLAEQLDTLISQTYPNIEIIVVDDCSTDSTIEILKKYESGNKIKLFLNEKNLGFGKNFEKAIKLCNGEFISLCDQDDIWDTNKIQKLYDNLGNHILIYHDSELINSSGQSLHRKMSDVNNFVNGSNNKAFIFRNCIAGHTMFFKRKLTEFIFPIPEIFFHDWWMVYAATTIDKITFIPDVLVKYRQHEKSYTDTLKLKETNDKTKGRITIADGDQRRLTNQKILERLEVLYQYQFNKQEDKMFLKKLIGLYTSKENDIFSFGLFTTLIMNINRLYVIDKGTGFLKKIQNILKESIGHRLKNNFHSYKKALKI